VRKVYVFVLFVLLIGIAIGCDADERSIEVVESTIAEPFDIETFDVRDIELNLVRNGETTSLYLSESMIASDISMEEGEHTIDLEYDGLRTSFDIELVFGLRETLRSMHAAGEEAGAIDTDFETWLTTPSERGRGIASIHVDADNMLVIEYTDEHVSTVDLDDGHTYHAVVFKDHDHTLIDVVMVRDGQDAEAPEMEEVRDIIFEGWSESYHSVDRNLSVVAEYYMYDSVDIYWEEGATITIGVDSDSMAEALMNQWEKDFPELTGYLFTTNYESANNEWSGTEGIETMKGEAPDIALVLDRTVRGKESSLLRLPDALIERGEANAMAEAYEAANHDKHVYLPAFYDGMAFSWNRTMLEKWGIDVDDVTEDNLPRELATWEAIFEYVDANHSLEDRPVFRDQTIYEFFPVSIGEAWSGYSSLTAGGWQLYGSGDYSDPEFDTDEFLKGLEFVETFSQTDMSVTEDNEPRPGAWMDWRWENYLQGHHPFGLVGTWMQVEDAMESNDMVFEFAPMPTFEDERLKPLTKSKGFVINDYTEYPSSAAFVLEWLYSKDVMEVMVENSTYLPYLRSDADMLPSLDGYRKDFHNALTVSHFESMEGLPQNPNRHAMDIYYDIGIRDYLMDIWNGDITPEEAQAAIVDSARFWMEEYNTSD